MNRRQTIDAKNLTKNTLYILSNDKYALTSAIDFASSSDDEQIIVWTSLSSKFIKTLALEPLTGMTHYRK